MDKIENVLSVIANVLTIIALSLALWRVGIMRKTFFSDHDRSRRTKAVDLIQFWSGKITKQSSIARKLVESFNEDQCKSLSDQREFNVDSNKLILVQELFPKGNFSSESVIKINDAQSSILRWEIVTYLNHLESVLAAWRHNVADQDIIEEQFRYLYDPKKNHTVVEKFRTAENIDNHPGIRDFINHLKKKGNKATPGKPIIG
jgi:hypothetical protein